MSTPPGGSYPGPDPDDPFAKPPKEGSPTEETAPIQREELGYWEKQAQEAQAAKDAAAAAGEPPPATGYTENPTSAQFAPDPTAAPQETNPWAGYGQPAAPQQPGYGQPPYGAQPPAYGAPPVPGGYYGGPAGMPMYQQPHPQATTVMVLGLIGLVGGCICYLPALVAPFAWVMGARVKREIRESNGQLGGEGNAQAGFVMGIIGTVVLALAIVALVLIVVIAVTADPSSTTGTTDF